MISAETSTFPENTSSVIDPFSNPNEIQERGPSRADPAQIADRSEQDRLHRGGGERPPNISDFPTQEELERHSGINPTKAVAPPETSVVYSASPDDNPPGISGPPPERNYHFKDGPANSTFKETRRQETDKVSQITRDWGKSIDEQAQEKLTTGGDSAVATDEPVLTRQGEVIYPEPVSTAGSKLEVTGEQTAEVAELPPIPVQSEPTNIDEDPLTASAHNLVAAVTHSGDQLGDLRFSEQREHELGQKYKVYTSGDGREILLTPEQEIDYARSFLERQIDNSRTTNATTEADTQKVEIPPQISRLIDDLEAGKVPTLLPRLARQTLIKLGVTPAQLNDFENRGAFKEALEPLISARSAGRLKEQPEVGKPTAPPTESTNRPPETAPHTKPEEKIGLHSKVQLTSAEMDQLIAESQAGKTTELDNKIKEFVAKVKSNEPNEPESEENKPSHENRIFTAAETARAKVAEVARAVALKTPGGEFIYKSAQRYLNNFDWRDKDKVAWAAGIATGFTTNTALNMVLPGAGSMINSVGTTAVTHLLSSGINSLRLRGIERSIRQNVNNLSEADVKAINVRSFRDQYDQASRLLKTSGLTDYQTEMTRISEDLLSQLGYREKDSFGPIVETLTQELQNKVFKYSKANERIRSFAAGMKVGAVTQGITNQFFDINKFVEHKLTGGPNASHIGDVETPLPEGLPPLSQDQIDLINRIHQDPEAWKTFTSLTPEQWSDVGRLYEADQLGNLGIETNPLLETLSNAEIGNLVDIHQGDTVSTLLQNNGHEITWTTADSDLFGGHVLANYQMLSETHNRMVESGLATDSFPSQQEVLSLIEHARGGDTSAFHDLQNSLDWIPVNQKLKILSLNDIADIADSFERKASEEIAEELINE